MRVIASPRSRASALLAPLARVNGWASLSGRYRGSRRGGRGRGGFRLLAVELLVVLLKDTLAFFGPLVQGFPVASLSPGSNSTARRGQTGQGPCGSAGAE